MNAPGRHPVAWSRVALRPPRAHGAPLSAAAFKLTPEDFRVEEILSFAPSGDGAHWLLQVEKRAANTRWVAGRLARLAGVAEADVGYAGLKDRQAVALQWFSVPAAGLGAEQWKTIGTPEFRVLDVHANARKLRRGALAGNRFRIRLRGAEWPQAELVRKLSLLRERGVPNYFGPQRFGRDASNLDRVAGWVQSGRAARGRTERGFTISAARALLFNAVLARRVEADDWARLAPGDVASLDGSASHFEVLALEEDLRRRLGEFDVHPSGPLWGRGELKTHGEARRHELAVAAEFAEVARLLEAEGLEQERRSLRCPLRDLDVVREPGALCLGFTLGRGQFATAVLRELCDFTAASEFEPDPE